MKFHFALALLFCSTFAVAGDPTPMEIFRSGKVDEAIHSLNTQVSGNPKNARAHADLCRVYSSVEDFDNAVQSCERAARLEPNVSEYHLWLGRAYGNKAEHSGPFSAIGWAKKAGAEFERAVQLAPNDISARSDLVEFYQEAPGMVGGGLDKAHRVAEETAKIDPLAATIMRTEFALKDKNYANAENEAKRAVQASDGTARYLLELARVYSKQKRWSDFESTIARAVDSNKKKTVDAFDAADMLVSNGRNLNGAIELLRSYLSGPMDEEGPAFRAYYLIGRAYEKQGNRTEAAKAYQSALQLAKGYRTAQDALRRVTS